MRPSWHALALKLHFFGGLVAAVFLLLLGATGSIMAFESDIDQLLHPSLFHVTPVGKALPLGTLAGSAAATLGPGERIGIYILPVKPDLSYGFTVFAAKKLPRQIFVDAYSGRVLGSLSALRFVVVVHRLHEAGGILMGCMAILLIPLVLSGLYLWWPTKQLKIAIRDAGRRLCFELHNAVGVFSSLFLLAFAVTGGYLAFEAWTVPLTYKLAGAKPLSGPSHSTSPTGAWRISPERAVAIARDSLPAAVPLWIVIPQDQTASYLVKMRFPEDHASNGASVVWVDQYAGSAPVVWNSRTAEVGRRVETLIRDIHTGDLGGYPGRTTESFMSLCLVVQTITGPYLWWTRRREKARNVRNV